MPRWLILAAVLVLADFSAAALSAKIEAEAAQS
jgi:hypothetical protein